MGLIFVDDSLTEEEKKFWEEEHRKLMEAQERVKEKLARGEEVPAFRYDNEDLSSLFQKEDDES